MEPDLFLSQDVRLTNVSRRHSRERDVRNKSRVLADGDELKFQVARSFSRFSI
jgi:hypothetical protein